MDNDSFQRKWRFGFLWVFVNMLSWLLLIPIGMGAGWFAWEIYQWLSDSWYYFFIIGKWLMNFVSDESNRLIIAMIIQGVCCGAIIGFLQQLVLKQRLDLKSRSWVLTTTIGFTLFLALASLVPFFPLNAKFRSESVYYAISMLGTFAGSTALGTAQWFVLRYYFNKAGWWIVATVTALGVLPFVINLLFSGSGWHGGKGYLFFSTLSSAIRGLIYGIITLITLNLLSKQSIKNNVLESQS